MSRIEHGEVLKVVDQSKTLAILGPIDWLSSPFAMFARFFHRDRTELGQQRAQELRESRTLRGVEGAVFSEQILVGIARETGASIEQTAEAIRRQLEDSRQEREANMARYQQQSDAVWTRYDQEMELLT
jgi:hypothetical protein